jgi:hypothetical protein
LKPQADKSEIHNLMSELQKFIKMQETKPNDQVTNELITLSDYDFNQNSLQKPKTSEVKYRSKLIETSKVNNKYSINAEDELFTQNEFTTSIISKLGQNSVQFQQ